MTEARPSDYWLSTSALFIQLNAVGDREYIHANCAAGAKVMCYMKDIIGYDNGHNYQRWTLVASPTVFHDTNRRYVYIAIPKSTAADATALVVFPAEKIDVYGMNESGTQVGTTDYYYIFTQGIISASQVSGVVQDRYWEQAIDTGSLASDEAIDASSGNGTWWEYNSTNDTVKFLKTISEMVVEKLTATWASIKQLVLNGHSLNEVAGDDTPETSDTSVVTPAYAEKHWLSKTHDDTAAGLIRFLKGLKLGSGDDLQITESGAATLFSTIVKSFLSSPTFINGFDGEGWKLWLDENGLSNLELDRLTVRQTMTVFELLIDKIRSVGGQIVVSAANGKIASVEEQGDFYYITFETDNEFQAGDLIRCQRFTGIDGMGSGLKSYWVEVAADDGTAGIMVLKSEFQDAYDGTGTETSTLSASLPEMGDEVVLMGSTQNANRQNLVLIAATEDGHPRIDVLNGVKEKSFSGCLRARLGNLDGIQDNYFPADNQPHGDGLYADNAYLRGQFLLSTGDNIETKFEIIEGDINSKIEAMRKDFLDDEGYLNNASFADGFSKWNTLSDTVFFLAGNKWIWANKNILSKKGDGATATTDDGRTVVRIKNSYIQQYNANLRSKPTFTANEDGTKDAIPVYLSFYYRVPKAGTLKIEFENVDKTGFNDFTSLTVSEALDVTNGYMQYTCEGYWNGTGDFKLSFDGEIYVYMLVLSTDKITSLTDKYRTLFEQSARLVSFAAQNLDKDGSVLESSGLMIKAEGSGIYTQTADGKLALIGVTVEETDDNGNKKSVVYLTADNIKLEGLVTANENFQILEDGSVVAKNGTFVGTIEASKGTIGGFTIGESSIYSNLQLSDKSVSVAEKTGFALYDNFLVFNNYNKDTDTQQQALIGTNWDTYSGGKLLARLLDTGYYHTTVSYNGQTYPSYQDYKFGLFINIRGALTVNDAIQLGGGCVSGLAIRTGTIPDNLYYEQVTSTERPTSADFVLDRLVNAYFVTTAFLWRAKEKDDSGNTVDFSKRTRTVNLTMPDMYSYDDGHVINIMRDNSSANNVYLIGGDTYWFRDGKETKMGKACFMTRQHQGYIAKRDLTEAGDGARYVFFRNISATIDGTTYYGVWVEMGQNWT